MEKEVNPDIVKATQESLGKYVKRPPLTEKLLKKPPFRFLHDIITSVLKSTGFFNGLFDEEELISDNVKDRERKISFLNKIITVLSTTTGKSLSVKPSKIIAGQEPEKTNELLQCLAHALDNNLSSDEAVKLYKESVKLNTSNEKKTKDLSPVKKSTDARKVTSKSSDKSVKSVKNDNNGPKLKQRENTIVKKENSKKLSQPPKVSSRKVSENIKQRSNSIKTHDDDLNNANLESTPHENFKLAAEDTNAEEANAIQENNIDSNVDTKKDNSSLQEISTIDNKQEQLSTTENNTVEDNLSNNNGVLLDLETLDNKIYDNKEKDSNLNNEDHTISSPHVTETKNVLKKDENPNLHDHNTDNIAQPQETKVSDVSNIKRPSSVRPPSSRPGAPRLREKHDNIISSADNLVAGKVNIIAETTVNEEEDESTIILMDNADTVNNMQEENAHLQTSDQHGHLVQQILDAQKEFTQAAGKTEIEWHFGTQKARDVLNQEIEQIRFNVQALSRVANPLGKLLDHFQEDVEVMRQELQQWTASYDHASKELLKQKVANEEYLLPLIARIKQLDVDIAEKHDKINDLRIIIHKNASRIDRLLSSGSL